MPTEADTCRKLVVPKLQAAGWDNDPFSIVEQRTITDGRIVPVDHSRIGRVAGGCDALKRLQAETAAELDALLPTSSTKLLRENYKCRALLLCGARKP